MVIKGHNAIVLTNNFNNQKRKEILNGVEVRRINFPKPKRFFFTFFSFPFIINTGRKVDIIHSSTYGGVFSASLASTILRKPSILSVHEIWMEKWKRVPFVSGLQKWTGSFQEWFLLNMVFDFKVTESSYTKNILEKIKKDYIFKIPAGIEVPENLRWDKKRGDIFKFLYFGRPGHWRGLDILIFAFEKFIKEKKNAKLILILAEEPEKEYKKIMDLISKMNLWEFIDLKNPMERKELFNFLMEVDCVVMPSISEGFGLSAAEASALSVPVISSDAGSLPEVVSGKCLFFKSEDIMDLKEKMIMAYNNQWNYLEKKEFSKINFLENWEKLYRRLLK